MKPRLSLSTTLVTALVLAALLPPLLVAWLLSSNSRDAIHLLAESTMRQAAQRMDAGALAHLGEAHAVLNAVLPPTDPSAANAQRSRNWLADVPSFETMAFALTQQSPNVPYIYFGTRNGSFFGLEKEARGFVARQIEPGDAGRSSYLLGQPGDRFELLDTEPTAYDPRQRPWYQLAALAGQRTFTSVYRSAVKPQFDLTLAQPVFDENGRTLLGVVAVDMSLVRLSELIQNTHISDNAVTFVVDGEGLLVASSVSESISVMRDGHYTRLPPADSSNALLRESFAQLSRSAPAGASQTSPVLRLNHGGFFQEMLGLETRAVVAIKRPFGARYGLNWQLYVVAPETDFTAPVNGARRGALALMAGLIGLCSALAFFAASIISKQFRSLNAAAETVGRGEVPPVQDAAPFSEVRLLSRVMHDSALQLQNYHQEVQSKNEQLREAAHGLEQRVVLRTAELAQSREEALAAVKAKAGFLAVVSHEIRTPLNGIVGMSELLSETSLNAEQRELFGVLRLSCQQMQSVVGDILDFSRIEAGRLELEEQPFNLRKAIADAQAMVRLTALEQRLTIQVSVASDLPDTVVGDITRLRQVLLNLLGNALKFTRSGHVALAVWPEPAARLPGNAAARKLCFSVADTGVGIAPNHIAHLFQPFAQGDTSTTRVYGGTGLGLAICKHLVHKMHGDISVRSEPGQGSCFEFHVWLPPVQAAAAEPTPPRQAPAAPAAASGLHVLVVDDNPINLKVASAMLLRLGHAHELAASGTEAVRRVQAQAQSGHAFTHVLLDRHMPDMDGLATARALQTAFGTAGPVLVGMSASSLAGDTQLFAGTGVAQQLPKPITLAALAQVLEGRTEQSSAQVRPAHQGTPTEPTTATPHHPHGELPCIDPQRWNSLGDLDASGALRRELLGDFLAALDERMARIHHFAAHGPAEDLRQTAHLLRGAATNVGAALLGQACAAVEQQAHSAPTHAPTLAALDQAVAHTRLAMVGLLTGR